MNGRALSLWQDGQVRVYLRWLFSAVALMTVWRVFSSDMALEPAFRETLFNVTSIMSGTGFFSGSFAGWGAVVLITALVLGTVGACSGSSAGGLSVFRVQIALYALRQQIGRIVNPNSVSTVKYDGKTVGPDVINAVMMFVASYIMIMGVLIIAMSLVGVDTESAVFAVWTSIGNVGYGFGPLVARTGTFVDFPQGAKAILTLAMILGRLGLLAILVLVLPSFWRR
ncbi:MAG: potassium transporter TrkG [Erythrobacter sp.]|nr:potassium transporter TrkG [Erythrobacter sp.]